MWHRTLLTILIKCWHVAEAFLSYFGITTASRECCVFVLCFMLFIGSCASAVFDYACTALSSESSLNVAESFWSSVFTDWTCDGDWFVFRGQWVDNVGPDLSWTTNTASRRKEKKKKKQRRLYFLHKLKRACAPPPSWPRSTGEPLRAFFPTVSLWGAGAALTIPGEPCNA